MSEALASGERDFEGKRLKGKLTKSLEGIKPLLRVPQDVDLTQEDWLELVASLDYLLTVRRLSLEKANAVLVDEKPRLVKWVGAAFQELKKFELIEG